jgi:hypothetical protein
MGSGLAVGVLAAEGCAVSSSASTATSQGLQVASFGWEAGNLYGNGANIYFKVLHNMFLQSINADLSASILKASTVGFAEILCVGGVSRGAAPTFNSENPQAYVSFPVSSNFGSAITENPNNLNLFFNGSLLQDQFLAVILKTWIPAEGTASATSRQVLAYPSINVNAGDYLVFHMDHQGVSVDAEMQIVITYSLI